MGVYDYTGRPVVPGGVGQMPWRPELAYGDSYWTQQPQPPRATNPGMGGYTMGAIGYRPMWDAGVPGGGQYGGGYGQYGGAGSGMAGYPSTPGGYGSTPGMPGLDVTTGGGLTAAGLFGDPKQAVMDALARAGINPWGPGVLTRRLIEQANPVITSLIPQLSRMGASANDPNTMRSLIDQQVQRAISGQSVFYSPQQAQGLLTELQARARGAGTPGMGDPGAAMLASIFSSPTQTTGLLNTLLYAGLGDRTGSFFNSQMDLLPATMEMAFRRPENRGASALDLLLSGALSDRTLFGAR